MKIGIAHSRGCPHLQAYALLTSRPFDRLIFAGSPRLGTTKLMQVWQRRGLAGKSISYWNGQSEAEHDFVTGVPFWIGGIAQFCPIQMYRRIREVPKGGDSWGVFAWHHFELYLAGMQAEDKVLGEELLAAYEYPGVGGAPAPKYSWDFKLPGDQVRGGMKRLPSGDTLFLFPGTEDGAEWISNFDAVPEEVTEHPEFGPVHSGFWAGVEAASAAMDVAEGGGGERSG